MFSSMEESNTGSTKPSSENSNYFHPSFINHRGHNNSATEETNLTFNNSSSCNLKNADSGYNSYSHCTPNDTPKACSTLLPTSSTTAVVTTPQKPSSNQHHYNHSNLTPITEITDPVKLTPITQNIRIFSSIHITTPKSQDFLNNVTDGENIHIAGGAGIKRDAINELKFDDYQSTPKKKRTDGHLESCPRNILNITTPLRGRKPSKSHRKLCRQKLRSAPDLDLNFFNDNAENISDDVVYRASQLTPIRSPFLFREQRTPLSSTSSNRIQASTPKTISKFDDDLPSLSSSVFDKPASVRKLLSFSDKEFEALLSSSSIPKEQSVVDVSKVQFESSINAVDIYQEDSFREYKKKQPIISSYTSIIPPYVPETNAAKRSFKRTLKFTYQASPSDESLSEIGVQALPSLLPQTSSSESSTEKKKADETDSFHDDSLKDYKTLYPVIDNAIRDRRILKRQRSSTTARLVDIRRESHSITKLIRTGAGNKKFSSAETIIPKQQHNKIEEKNRSKEGGRGGFQEILGYVPSSCDLKISAKNEDKNDNHDNYQRHIERKLSDGSNDMDISPNPLNFSASSIATTSTTNFACDSLHGNTKLLESVEEGASKLNSDWDVLKNSSKESSMSIDKTPEPQKNNEKAQESNIGNNKLLSLNQALHPPLSNNVDIRDECWLSSIDFEVGILTPPRPRRSLSPSNNCNVLQTNFCETEKFLPTTPKKIKQRNNHHALVDYERNEILYPTIPRTPKKLSSQSKHKTCATSSVPLKRKASIVEDIEKRTKIFYDGFTHLNILAKLESYDLVLDRIFNMLSSHDLMNLTLASKNLRNIVLLNQKAEQRISNYLIEYQKTKENGGEYFTTTKKCVTSQPLSKGTTSSFAARLSSVIQLKKQSSMPESNRMPFKNSNSIFDRRRSSVVIQRSPPVSPSKRKFHENQKVVKLLSCHEKLVKCPRCSRSSRIINTLLPTLDSNGNHRSNDATTCFNSNLLQISSTNQQAFHLASISTSTNFNNNNKDDEFVPISNPQPSSSLSLNSFVPQSSSSIRKKKSKFVKSMSADLALYLPTTPKKQRLADSNVTKTTNSNVFKQYGECTGILCKYRFCLACLCEYHPDTSCKIGSTVNNSPPEEDVQNGILEINSMYTTAATLATMTAAAVTSSASGSNVTTSATSTSSGSRSLKFRRKSLKRLCF